MIVLNNRILIRKDKCRPATTTPTTPVSRSGCPPLDSEKGWTGELWQKTNLLNWKKTKGIAKNKEKKKLKKKKKKKKNFGKFLKIL